MAIILEGVEHPLPIYDKQNYYSAANCDGDGAQPSLCKLEQLTWLLLMLPELLDLSMEDILKLSVGKEIFLQVHEDIGHEEESLQG